MFHANKVTCQLEIVKSGMKVGEAGQGDQYLTRSAGGGIQINAG